MSERKIKTALISVYHKHGLDDIIKQLGVLNIRLFSTGGTYDYIRTLGVSVEKVEDITGYPSILDGRVKTLHPMVFGGILAKREDDHLSELQKFSIPQIDLVITDLYPFESTVQNSKDPNEIIEKIDIGGISLIRAAAKNYHDVLIIPSQNEYKILWDILSKQNGNSFIDQRKLLATKAFLVSSRYDRAIYNYFSKDTDTSEFSISIEGSESLRYGENPHQKATYFGDLNSVFEKLCGKDLSYNNLVDIDAAIQLMADFDVSKPCFAILKHTNVCGIASRSDIYSAWQAALAADPVSAFGGILISNSEIDLKTAEAINGLFYEVLIAPSFSDAAYSLLSAKQKRVLLRLKSFKIRESQFKSLLNGIIMQETDLQVDSEDNLEIKTIRPPSETELSDLLFAAKCAKHLKSNTIVLVKNNQLLGMGCGQTSRIDACRQAIEKAKHFGFDLNGAVMASDAFFPFPDCVELVQKEGIISVIQPGGSIKDQLSIDFCNHHNMTMVFSGNRHFKH